MRRAVDLSGYLEILLPFTCYSPLPMHMSPRTFMFLLDRFPFWFLKYGARTKISYGWVGEQGAAPDLSAALDRDVQMFRSKSFITSTWRTYSAQLSAYIEFCNKLKIALVPISKVDLGRYIAFLSRRLAFASVRQYLNIVRLLHVDSGLRNSLEQNWYVNSVLKGVCRVKSDTSDQKLPITLDILRAIFIRLDLNTAFERSFWTACLVAFFFFFRKSNLLVQSHILFDPTRHLWKTPYVPTLSP